MSLIPLILQKKKLLGSKLNLMQALNDGNTVVWLDSQDLDTISKNESNQVQYWYDKLGSGRRVAQGTVDTRPVWSESGILFDGVDDRMLMTATLNQPESVYIVFTTKTFEWGDRVFDGYNNVSCILSMEAGGDGKYKLIAGLSNDSGVFIAPLAGNKMIMRIFINGENSRLVVNENLPVTGNFGDRNMGGLCLGSQGNNANHGNVEINEVILRKGIDTAAKEKVIYDYLKKKNNVMLTEYETLSEYAYYAEPQSVSIGDASFSKLTSEPIDCGIESTFEAKKVENAYALIGSEKSINASLINPQIMRFVEDEINCSVFDFKGNYIYYGHSAAFYRINKNTFDGKVKFTISGNWAGGTSADVSTNSILGVTEMADGGLLIQVANNHPNCNFYKLPYIENPESLHNFTENDAVLAFVTKASAPIVRRSWQLDIKDNIVFASIYNARGAAYLSQDYGNTWKCVFSMVDSSINTTVTEADELFVDTKPDGLGGFGAIGGHPMKDTLTNPQTFELWGDGSSTNLHAHGAFIDRYANRIYVVTGDNPPKSGIYYSDDWGYNWTYISTSNIPPSTIYTAQFVSIIPVEKFVLFGTAGMSDGLYRVFRDGENLLDTIECCYQYSGSNTSLTVQVGGHCVTPSGITLIYVNPRFAIGAETIKGGIVATKNGHDFKKLYEDSFSEFTAETSEFGSQGMITVNNNGKVIINAQHGGILTLDLIE